jgi:hypothetical protein
MGDWVEIHDVNGNLVRVPLYPTIVACARALHGSVAVPMGDGNVAVMYREEEDPIEAAGRALRATSMSIQHAPWK